MQARGCVFEQASQRSVDFFILNQVIIIEDENQLTLEIHQSLDQFCWNSRPPAGLAVFGPDTGCIEFCAPFLQTGCQVLPEMLRGVIRFIEREPSEGGCSFLADGLRPGADQRRFARPGRGGDQRQAMSQRLIQFFQQLRTRHKPAWRGRGIEFGWQEQSHKTIILLRSLKCSFVFLGECLINSLFGHQISHAPILFLPYNY